MENAKILIVDDDVDLTKVLGATLETEQYTVVTAADRTEGIEKLKAEKPDLVILDVMMSTWQDGFEMARELKQDPQFSSTPIMMMTALKGKTGMDFKSSAGDQTWCPVDVFLDKPIEPDVLLAEVKKLLQKKA